tara:strand:+ start:358 stop:699 length:342 start_codon:yes stop_codon:yes gene_type:complete
MGKRKTQHATIEPSKKKQKKIVNYEEDEERSYDAIFEEYQQSRSNPFLPPLETLCKTQQLSKPAKVKLLFHLDKLVRKYNIVYVDETDTRKGSHMEDLRQLHLRAFLYNKFPN